MDKVSGEVIYTYYKRKKERRGTLKDKTFIRYNTPLVWGKEVPVEPDVLINITQRGAANIHFIFRPECAKIVGQEDLDISLEDFKKYAVSKTVGVPDKREQYFLDVFKYLKRKKDNEGQLPLFK